MTSGPLARARLPLARSPLNRLAGTAAFALFAILSAGCDGASSTTARNTPDAGVAVATTELDSFVEQAAAAACAWQFQCCSLPELDTLTGSAYLTEAACRTVATRLLNRSLSDVRIAIGQGHTSIDPTLAAACIQQIRSGSCNDPTRVVDPLSPGPADRVNQCASPFVGHLPPDALCLLAAECRPGSSCNLGGLNQDMGITPAGLRPGLLIGSAVSPYLGHCQLDTKEGDSCFATNECPAGLYCRHPDFVCARPAADGESCSVRRDMVGVPQGVACGESPQPLVCVADRCRHLPRRDEPCLPATVSTLGFLPCDPSPALGLTCVGQGFNGSGICKSFARLGEGCSFNAGLPPCEPPLACTIDGFGVTSIGTCAPARAIGAPCGDGQCAPPGVCYEGALSGPSCVLPPPVRTGTACRSDLECASLNCPRNFDTPATPTRCSANESSVVCAGAGRFSMVGGNPPRDDVGDGGGSADGGQTLPGE